MSTEVKLLNFINPKPLTRAVLALQKKTGTDLSATRKIAENAVTLARRGCLSRLFFTIPLTSCLIFALSLTAQQNPTQTSTQPPANDKDTKSTGAIDDRKPAQPQPSAAGAPVDSNSYKVGPADVLNIRVWNEAQFSGPVSVHQDGKITLPLVGDLDAGGLTPVQIEQNVAKALTKYVVKPLVTVTVQDVGSKYYYMDGAVNKPGRYPLIVPTTVLNAISDASGPGDWANTKKIYILRGNKKIPFNLREVMAGRHMEQNIFIQPGDHIFIPQ